MGERYLNDCVTLLLDVECCHDFGTKHLDEYAEQPRPCVIYAKSVRERVQFQSVCVCMCVYKGERCGEGEHFAEMIPFS